MGYIETFTRIPIPHVIHHCVEADGGDVGSTYILMTKADGVLLYPVWDNMDDGKRRAVLRQVAYMIVLELSSQRFDQIRTLSSETVLGRAPGTSNQCHTSWILVILPPSPRVEENVHK
jgi:hypothetical protein